MPCLIHDLPGEQGGPQPGVNQSRHLEEGAIGSLEENGENGGPAMPGQAGNHLMPRGFTNPTTGQIKMSYFTGGEHAQCPAGFQPS